MEVGIPMTEDELRKIQIDRITLTTYYPKYYLVKAISKDSIEIVVICRSNIKDDYDIYGTWENWFSDGIIYLGIDQRVINIIR